MWDSTLSQPILLKKRSQLRKCVLKCFIRLLNDTLFLVRLKEKIPCRLLAVVPVYLQAVAAEFTSKNKKFFKTERAINLVT